MIKWWMHYYCNEAKADGSDAGGTLSTKEADAAVLGGDRDTVGGEADSVDPAWALFEKDFDNDGDEEREAPAPTDDKAEEKAEDQTDEQSADDSTEQSTDDSDDADTEDDTKDDQQEEQKKEDQQQGQEPIDPAKAREEWVNTLEHSFTIDEATADQLRVEPEKVLPRLLAQVQASTVETTIKTLMQALPEQIQRVTSYTAEAAKAEKQFFKTWPELGKPEHLAVVKQAVQTYRTMNPQAQTADVIKQAGMLAYVQLGLSIGDLANRISGQDMAEEVDLQQVQSSRPAPGLQPAKTGQKVPTQQPVTQSEKNFFEQWADDHIAGLDD